MKANELMIGDWVRGFVPDSNSTIYGIFNEQRVAIIAEPSKAYIELSIDDIQPIPLTPDILEKNGWFYPKQSVWMKLDSPYRELWGCLHTDGTIWLYPSGDCDRHDSFAEIRFVHELQHALRLCGIDKEIVL